MTRDYYSPPQLAEALSMSLRGVQRRLHDMRPYIGTKYPESLTDGKVTRVRLIDFVDFGNHRKELTA